MSYAKTLPKVKGLSVKPLPEQITEDYVGPPDKQSNLRQVVRHIPKNETKLQHSLRTKRTEVEDWNQEFWTSHNKRFFEVHPEYSIMFFKLY